MLPDNFKAEVDYRSRIKDADYKWTVAVVEIHRVSDTDSFLDQLKKYVKANNSNHAPSDKIMRGELPNELYIMLSGTEEQCFLKLAGFFGDAGIRPMLHDVRLTARLGLSQYECGKSPSELIQEARMVRPMGYTVGSVASILSEPDFERSSIEETVSEVI